MNWLFHRPKEELSSHRLEIICRYVFFFSSDAQPTDLNSFQRPVFGTRLKTRAVPTYWGCTCTVQNKTLVLTWGVCLMTRRRDVAKHGVIGSRKERRQWIMAFLWLVIGSSVVRCLKDLARRRLYGLILRSLAPLWPFYSPRIPPP